ncbi:MAG: polysaccharide pyruvyl transferase family protein [Caulobacteraceae bacterium]|nr:MAG: polysaccharide pyruvyl transferase family protein [Caulobacteraceae bacterium]
MTDAPGSGRGVVLINDTRADLHHGCWRVMRTLEAQLARVGLRVLARAPAHLDWRKDPAVGQAIARAALVVVNGEGTIHHDRPAGAALLAVGAAARAAGVPAALINASWDANGPAYAEALGDFSLVSARETRSAAQIQSAGLSARVVPDLSLFEPVVPPPTRAGVGFTDSVLRGVALDLETARKRLGGIALPIHFNPPGLKGSLKNLRDGVARRDLADPGFLARAIAARLAWRAAETPDEADYMARVARLDLLVTGRFHAATFALAARTPVLAAESNTHKIGATFDDAGLAPWRRIAPADLTADLLDRARHWEPAETAALEDFLADGRRATTALFDDLAKLAA